VDPKHSYNLFKLLMNINRKFLEKGDNGSKFRTRARDIPAQVRSVGLAYTMLYLYSKATDKGYRHVLKIMNGGEEEASEKSNNRNNVKSEELSHAIYLYIIKWLLDEVVGYRDKVSDDDIKSYISSLLRENERDSMAYGQILIPYLLMVKRFAEAMYQSEQ